MTKYWRSVDKPNISDYCEYIFGIRRKNYFASTGAKDTLFMLGLVSQKKNIENQFPKQSRKTLVYKFSLNHAKMREIGHPKKNVPFSVDTKTLLAHTPMPFDQFFYRAVTGLLNILRRKQNTFSSSDCHN